MNRKTDFTALTAALLFSAVSTAHANTCDSLYQAGIKSVQTPHHVYSTTTMRGDKPRTGEAIFDGKAEYLQLRGKWMCSPMPRRKN